MELFVFALELWFAEDLDYFLKGLFWGFCHCF